MCRAIHFALSSLFAKSISGKTKACVWVTWINKQFAKFCVHKWKIMFPPVLQMNCNNNGSQSFVWWNEGGARTRNEDWFYMFFSLSENFLFFVVIRVYVVQSMRSISSFKIVLSWLIRRKNQNPKKECQIILDSIHEHWSIEYMRHMHLQVKSLVVSACKQCVPFGMQARMRSGMPCKRMPYVFTSQNIKHWIKKIEKLLPYTSISLFSSRLLPFLLQVHTHTHTVQNRLTRYSIHSSLLKLFV